MSDRCLPSWSFAAADGPVPWPCGGDRLCLRPLRDGSVDVGIVVVDGRAVVRRGGHLLLDGTVPEDAWFAHGTDGCGTLGELAVLRDVGVAFGWHRYTLDGAGSAALLAPGPDAADPTPGLVLGLVMVACGALLARVPPRWGW